jgi:hypothetical protein
MKSTWPLVTFSAGFCLASIVLFGCTTSTVEVSDEGLFPARKSKSAADSLAPLEYTGVATITGVVEYDGTPPPRPEIESIFQHADRSVCVQGDVRDQTWMVNDGKVANVVVYVRPPKGFYFKKPEESHKSWVDEVIVDQPQCQFIPHVVVLYPQYREGGQLVRTGQVLKVLNSAPIGHNIKVAGSSDTNPASGATLSAKNGVYVFDKIVVDRRELTMNCDVHKWMNGYALTFDHPYAAVTNERGEYTIKNVPAGVELTLRGWHEALKPGFDPSVEGGPKIKLNPGETRVLNFKVKGR